MKTHTISAEFRTRVADLLSQHKKLIATGMDTCPWCRHEVPAGKMTASASLGVICHDCLSFLAN